jgi:hypothetical protein
MKNVLLSLLVLMSVAAYSQTTYTLTTTNPLEITAPDNTNTHVIQFPLNGATEFRIQFPSGNTGTVQVNAASNVFTNSPALSSTTDSNGIAMKSSAKTGYKVYLKFSNAADKVVVTIW